MNAILAFGFFRGCWAWRVEWPDQAGQICYQDFRQKDLRPGEAKQEAEAFRDSLVRGVAA